MVKYLESLKPSERTDGTMIQSSKIQFLGLLI